MDTQELSAWLRLILTPQVGPVTARHLLAAFGSPQGIFAASLAARAAVVGMNEARLLGAEPATLAQHYQATQAWLASGPHRSLLTLADPRYPRGLLETHDPPLLLFAQGHLTLLDSPAIAVVGSRSPTPQGREHAQAFARSFAQAGLVVVSGLALGIDGAAHEGALAGQPAGALGSTIAVVGTGLDRVYPKRHYDLAHQVAQNGLILSEYILGTPPLAAHFPQRNRLIAGLARGVLVVEAAMPSGSLLTARLASEMGREVLAIPGSIHSPLSRGCHALIKQGAKLVETAQDVLDEIFWNTTAGSLTPTMERTMSTSQLTPEADQPAPMISKGALALLADLGFDPIGLDELAARTGLASSLLNAQLLELELAGQLERLPGARFQRRSVA